MAKKQIRHRRPVRSGGNSTKGEKAAENLHGFFTRIISSLSLAMIVVAAVVLVLIAAAFWFSKPHISARNAFWVMLDNNLSTYSVTREVKQQDSSGGSKELTQIIFNPQPRVRDIRNVTSGSSQVKIESIGTPNDTYKHYLAITQPGTSGPRDYSSVYPLWLKNDGVNQGGDSELFNNSLFGAFLFGNLSKTERVDTLAQLKKAYQPDFNTVKQKNENGRLIYTYQAKLNLREYANAARTYAKAIGLSSAAQINPEDYRNSPVIELSVSVDARSKEIRQITYLSSQVTENYSGYGAKVSVDLPKRTVDYSTLQNAVRSAASQ